MNFAFLYDKKLLSICNYSRIHAHHYYIYDVLYDDFDKFQVKSNYNDNLFRELGNVNIIICFLSFTTRVP
jgi:hypothetical protein